LSFSSDWFGTVSRNPILAGIEVFVTIFKKSKNLLFKSGKKQSIRIKGKHGAVFFLGGGGGKRENMPGGEDYILTKFHEH
jgi:hypothetical protein